MAAGPQTSVDNIDPTFAQTAQNFAQSLHQAPGVSTAMWGAPFNGSDTTPSDFNVAASMNNFAFSILQAGLDLIMSDVPTFVTFAGGGFWSGPTTFGGTSGAPGAATGLLAPFSTYIVSEILAQNSFSASPPNPIASTTKALFQLGRACTTAGDVCSNGESTWYWSSVTEMQYGVSFSGAATSSVNNASSLLSYIEQNSDVNFPILFDGAYNCTLEGKSGGSVVNFNADGTLDLSCLSSIPMYLSKGAKCPKGAVLSNGKCPFGFNT